MQAAKASHAGRAEMGQKKEGDRGVVAL